MQHITLEILKEWKVVGREFVLIDVREPEEHEAYNIGGRLIPLGEITQRIAQIPTNLPVVIYCKRGIRSQIAIQKLQRKSTQLDNLYNLRDGIIGEMGEQV